MNTALHQCFYIINSPTITYNISCLKQGARMHVVSRAPFDAATRQFPNQAPTLDDLYRVLKKEHYPSPDDMRKRFPSLDRMKSGKNGGH